MCDTVVESDEEFNINLIGNSAVTLGTQSSTVGVIIDSSGMCSSVMYLLVVMMISGTSGDLI